MQCNFKTVNYNELNLGAVFLIFTYFVFLIIDFIVFFKNIDSCQIGNTYKVLNFKTVVFHNSFRSTVLEEIRHVIIIIKEEISV